MLKKVKQIIPKKWIDSLSFDPTKVQVKESYAIAGEDLLINSYLNSKAVGSYVDIGAHHPFKFSNTYFFYLKNWSGVNIDPMPQAIDSFNTLRPRDINIEAAVGSGEAIFYEFSTSAVNTFSDEYLKSNLKHSEIVNQRTIKLQSLESLLAQVFPNGKDFDFLSIDIEGGELNALETNNWNKFRFNYILVEIFHNSMEEVLNNPISLYLQEKGYLLCGMNINNAFFKLQKS